MISVIEGFKLNKRAPIDDRIKVADQTARLALTFLYFGLEVYQVSNDTYYTYTGDTISNLVGDWEIKDEGPQGVTGPVGPRGPTVNKYKSSSTDTLSVPEVHPAVMDITLLEENLCYGGGERIVVAGNGSNYFIAEVVTYHRSTKRMTIISVSNVGSGTFSAWTVNIRGQLTQRGIAMIVNEWVDLTAAKVADVEALSDVDEWHPYIMVIKNDFRTGPEKADTPTLNESTAGKIIRWDGTSWIIFGSFVGPVGLQGDAGVQGSIGVLGINGPVGPVGPKGLQGNVGPQGNIGVQGIQGFIGSSPVSEIEVARSNSTLNDTATQKAFKLVLIDGASRAGSGQCFYGFPIDEEEGRLSMLLTFEEENPYPSQAFPQSGEIQLGSSIHTDENPIFFKNDPTFPVIQRALMSAMFLCRDVSDEGHQAVMAIKRKNEQDDGPTYNFNSTIITGTITSSSSSFCIFQTHAISKTVRHTFVNTFVRLRGSANVTIHLMSDTDPAFPSPTSLRSTRIVLSSGGWAVFPVMGVIPPGEQTQYYRVYVEVHSGTVVTMVSEIARNFYGSINDLNNY